MNLIEFLNTAPVDIIIFILFSFAFMVSVIIWVINRLILKTFFWDKDGWVKKEKIKTLKYFVASQMLFIIIFIGIIILILPR